MLIGVRIGCCERMPWLKRDVLLCFPEHADSITSDEEENDE